MKEFGILTYTTHNLLGHFHKEKYELNIKHPFDRFSLTRPGSCTLVTFQHGLPRASPFVAAPIIRLNSGNK
jgi:hypothetical protein